MPDALRWTALALVALATTLAAARLGAWLARVLRQPEVVGEIAFGLLAGPLLLWAGSSGLREALLGGGRLEVLDLVAHGGLVLFMVGVGHELKVGAVAPRARALVWTALGALVLPAAAGLLMAAWVRGQGPDLRGDAPDPAFTLTLAVALTVTAVPVLARILLERGRLRTPVARLALSAAALIDLVAWAVLALAITLAAGGSVQAVLGRTALLLGAGVAAAVFSRVLRHVPTHVGSRAIRTVLIGLAAIGLSVLARAWGVNEILLALVLGLALPADGREGPWTRAVEVVARGGRVLVPVFFFVTGIGVFAAGVSGVPWAATGIATGLAVLGKVGGTYLGARLGGCPPKAAVELGVLLNTRGLTELVVLQAAYTAGIIPPALYLALVLMTLVTTAMTGPLHNGLTRRESAPRTAETTKA